MRKPKNRENCPARGKRGEAFSQLSEVRETLKNSRRQDVETIVREVPFGVEGSERTDQRQHVSKEFLVSGMTFRRSYLG